VNPFRIRPLRKISLFLPNPFHLHHPIRMRHKESHHPIKRREVF